MCLDSSGRLRTRPQTYECRSFAVRAHSVMALRFSSKTPRSRNLISATLQPVCYFSERRLIYRVRAWCAGPLRRAAAGRHLPGRFDQSWVRPPSDSRPPLSTALAHRELTFCVLNRLCLVALVEGNIRPPRSFYRLLVAPASGACAAL